MIGPTVDEPKPSKVRYVFDSPSVRPISIKIWEIGSSCYTWVDYWN